jgi:hypothetical protein
MICALGLIVFSSFGLLVLKPQFAYFEAGFILVTSVGLYRNDQWAIPICLAVLWIGVVLLVLNVVPDPEEAVLNNTTSLNYWNGGLACYFFVSILFVHLTKWKVRKQP